MNYLNALDEQKTFNFNELKLCNPIVISVLSCTSANFIILKGTVMSLDKNQRFVSSTGNMEVLFSHTHLIVGALAYFKLLIIFLRIFNILLGFIVCIFLE